MKYYQLLNMPRLSDNYIFINELPGTGELRYKAWQGESIISLWPADLKIYMEEERNILTPIIPNTCNVFVVCEKIMEIFIKMNLDIECIPLHIFDYPKNPLVEKYYIIHPKTVFDCLDLENSEVLYNDSDEILEVGFMQSETEGLVLSSEKMAVAPEVFRMKYSPTRIIVNEQILKQINEAAGHEVQSVLFEEML